MAKATDKAPGIEAVLTQITGVDRPTQVAQNKCTWCKGPAVDFRNPLSKKEYTISGFCQKCQDDTFGPD